jgi:hypothetical protein
MLTSCWARYRIEPNAWAIAANDWKDIEDFGNNDNSISSSNAIKESDLLDKFLPIAFKPQSALRRNSQFGVQDRRKKFLTDPTNIQGLWAMPGRR